MIKMLKKYERTIAILLIAFLALPVNLFTSIATVLAEDGGVAEVVYQEDFEDGVGRFIESGGALLERVTDVDFSENGNALSVSNRTADYAAADLTFKSLDLKDGYTYRATVTGYIDAETDVPEGSQVVLSLVDSYTWLNNVDMVAGEAFTLTKEFTTANEADHTLRIQSNDIGEEVPFYIDNVVIEVSSTPEPEPEPEPVIEVTYEENFEDGVGRFIESGGALLERVTGVDFTENGNALSVSNRTADYAAADLTFASLGLEDGYTYTATVKGYVADETDVPDGSQVVLSLVDSYTWLNNVDMVAGEAFTLTKEFTTANEADHTLRIQSNDIGEEVPFYIGEILITREGSPSDEEDPVEIPEDERVAIFTDFEDGTNQGWVARGDNEQLTVTTDDAKNGDYSLLVENRQASSDAALIEFLDDMHPGYEYEFSLWVKLAPGEEDTPLQLSAAETVNGETSYYPPVIAPTMVTADEWVLLEGTYNVPKAIEALSFYIEEEYDEDSTSGVSYYIDDFKAEVFIADYPVQKDLAPLHELYEGLFHIGNAVESVHFNGRTLELLTHHHNLVTAENVMKPENYYNNGEFTHTQQDQWLRNAVSNNLLIHGHVLLWHSQSEDSLYQNPDGTYKSPEEALANMHRHIEDVMTTADAIASDNIISWDVVNEALDGDWSNPEDWENILRPASGWLQAIGPDYMYEAFLKARQVADELGQRDMVLYYNDYNDHVQNKARTMYHMVKDINERYADEYPDDERLLIGGVGMQAHYTTTVNVENVRESLERFISLGVEVGVTELDVGASEGTTLTEKENLEQAYFYAQLFNLYREHAENISRVTFWGLSDGNSWRSENSPLLFDRNLQAKTAYHAVADPEKYLAENEDPGQVIARQGTAAYGTPTMDGEIDKIWELAPVLPINRFQTAHNGATGEARVLWDNQNIYVLVEVNDNELDKSNSQAHEQDSVEVFIDEQNTKSASFGEGHGQYRVNFDNEQSFNPGPIEGFESRTFVKGTNYVVEMKIPFSTTTLEVGDMIGFDVQINDAVNGNRNSVAIWSDVNSGMGWSDPSVFGEVTLLADVSDNEIIIDEGEPVEIQPEQKVIVKSGEKEFTLKTPAELPTGTEIQVNFVDPTTIDEPKSESGDKLEIAGEIVTVDLLFPEGFENFEGDFEITLTYNEDYQWVSAFYYNEEEGVWERRTGGIIDRDKGEIRLTVRGFSTYGVFEVGAEEVIEDLEEVIRDLTDRVNNLDENVAGLEEVIAELREELEGLITSDQTLRDLIADLLTKLEALEDRIAELEGNDGETPGTGGETPGEGEETPGTGDETPGTGDKTDEDEDPVLVGGSDNGSTGKPTDKDGDALPSTATSLFNYMLIGALVLLVGTGLALYSYKRKRA